MRVADVGWWRVAGFRCSPVLLVAGLLAGCAEQTTAPELDSDAPRAARDERSPSIEDRVRGLLVTGTWSAAGPHVKVFDGATTSLLSSFFAYSPSFLGGVRVAVGDVNGDGRADVVTGTGPGAAHVKVFDGGTDALLSSFFAYGDFTGGVFVAAGDVDGDGYADVITGADAGGAPHVKVFSGASGELLKSFFAFDGGFTGGVTVAAGDVNGDGHADIIVGAGPGGGAHVKVFDGATDGLLSSFFAYGAGFTGGVFVASGDVDGDGYADIVTGPGPGAPSHVKAFSGATGDVLASFFAFDGFSGGISVAAADVDGDGRADIATGAGPGAAAHVKVFSGATGGTLASFFAYGDFSGGVFVAAGERGDALPPSVGDVLTAARQAVDDGTLVGAGPTGPAADGRLNAWLNMLAEAQALIESGDVEEACGQLLQAYLRADGASPPPDFVAGDAREEVADTILWLRQSLGC